MGEHVIVLDQSGETGWRLKYYGVAADTAYWTARWEGGSWLYDRQLRGHLPHQLRAVFRRWVPAGARVLEAGCGIGQFTVAAHALGYRAEGLDWSAPTIDRLRARFPEIAWHVGDVRALDFADGEFDAIYSPGVCEHVEEGPAEILAETLRVLRPGGVAVISTPCFNRWLQARAGRFVSAARPEGAFYQYAFAPDGLTALLTRLGFEVVQVRPYGTADTLARFAGLPIPRRLYRALAILDYTPILRSWGRCCLWIARRP